MARTKGTRRSISMPVETYWRLKKLADLNIVGENPTQVVQLAVNSLAERYGIPRVSREDALRALPQRPQEPSLEIASQHFTF